MKVSPGALLLAISVVLWKNIDARAHHIEQANASAHLVLRARLSGQPPEAYEFTTITQVAAGRRFVYVGQEGVQGVRVFHKDGRYFKTIGRNGGGPGEFRELQYYGLVDDTLWTIDTGLRRITLFSDTGRVLSTSIIDQLGSRGQPLRTTYFSMPVALGPRGVVLGYGGTTGQALAQGLVREYPILALTRRGAKRPSRQQLSTEETYLKLDVIHSSHAESSESIGPRSSPSVSRHRRE